jgi:hypothetical protein
VMVLCKDRESFSRYLAEQQRQKRADFDSGIYVHWNNNEKALGRSGQQTEVARWGEWWLSDYYQSENRIIEFTVNRWEYDSWDGRAKQND